MQDGATRRPEDEARMRRSILQALDGVTNGILEMARCLQSLDVHRAPPSIWNIVTGLWCSTRPRETGFDGTSAPSFGLLDSFFGRSRFDSELGRMNRDQFSQRIPRFQRDVLLAVEREDFPSMIRQAWARWPEEGDFGWNRCLQEYHALLRAHLRKVFAYLEVGRMVTGRDAANGRLHWHLAHQESGCAHRSGPGAPPRDFFDAFERAIAERGKPGDSETVLIATSEETSGGAGTVRRYTLSTVSADRRRASLTVARQGRGSRFVIGEAGAPRLLNVRVAPSSFRLPADERAPVAIIARGAGISPFSGFIEARTAAEPARRGRKPNAHATGSSSSMPKPA